MLTKVVYILGIVLEEDNIEWHTSKFQQNMYVLVLLAQSDASAIFEKHLWTHYGWEARAVLLLKYKQEIYLKKFCFGSR